MKCPDVRENLAAYLDGEVEGAPRMAMDQHFLACPACSAERSAQAAAWRLLDLVDAPAAPAGFTGRVEARVRAGETGREDGESPDPVPAGGAPRFRLLGLPLPAFAAAASVLLVAGGAFLLHGTGDSTVAAAPPQALFENLPVIESLDALQDDDIELLDRLSGLGDEDLAVLGG